MKKTLCPALGLTLIAAGFASAETRELDAHEHGHGALNIAIEGSAVVMELEVPGADIVGFEHAAESAADRALIDAAIADLAKPLDLFVLPAKAGCTVTKAAASLIGEDDDHGDHDDEHGHKDAHDHKDEHAHKDEHDHKDEHAHEDEHDHGEHAGESHTEFHAEYALTCADPSAIDAINFAYFKRFPNAVELDIQMISDKGAKGFEVESDDPQLDLSGAI